MVSSEFGTYSLRYAQATRQLTVEEVDAMAELEPSKFDADSAAALEEVRNTFDPSVLAAPIPFKHFGKIATELVAAQEGAKGPDSAAPPVALVAQNAAAPQNAAAQRPQKQKTPRKAVHRRNPAAEGVDGGAGAVTAGKVGW